ncbi:OLC1v1011148C1 [Oldenlandia corymbosa var. corymbosa]|uniref:OLC1v1011148C1 n=1 Tax=Oldenlandia corymbosa var. corymbosa TaxID=529605 RepID=A0AAV1DSW9_OLDCO|nr:OLC1v1011148C1 [Oldenlandia corymbosa var. corymbosa]
MALEINQGMQLIEREEVFTVAGRDKKGRLLVTVIGKYFPVGLVSVDSVKKYLEEKVYPALDNQPFSVVYFHSDVEKSDNNIGISALRSIYDSIPIKIRDNLRAVYFVHPSFQFRLFMATVGRFMFAGGLYGKIKYVIRLDFLWENVRRKEIDIPEFVCDRDEELDRVRSMDYCIESDHPRVCRAPDVDSSMPMYYSTRCIS